MEQRGDSNVIPMMATYDLARVDWSYAFSGDTTYSIGSRLSGNLVLQWEVDEDFNLGLDATTLNNTLHINLEYFNNVRKLLLNAPIQLSFRRQYGWDNSQRFKAGALRNQGWKATISFDDKKVILIIIPILTWGFIRSSVVRPKTRRPHTDRCYGASANWTFMVGFNRWWNDY